MLYIYRVGPSFYLDPEQFFLEGLIWIQFLLKSRNKIFRILKVGSIQPESMTLLVTMGLRGVLCLATLLVNLMTLSSSPSTDLDNTVW